MSDVTIPESDETLKAKQDLFEVLEGDVGFPSTLRDAISALIDAKVADAVEYAADRVEAKVAAIRSSHD